MAELELGDLIVRLKADVSAFEKAMKTGGDGLDKVTKGAKSAGFAVISLNQGIELFKKTARAAVDAYATLTDQGATDAYLRSVDHLTKSFDGLLGQVGLSITQSAAFQEAMSIVSGWLDQASDASAGLGTKIGDFLAKAFVGARYALAAFYGLLATGSAIVGVQLKVWEYFATAMKVVSSAVGLDGVAGAAADAEKSLHSMADNAFKYASDKAADTVKEVSAVDQALDKVDKKQGQTKGRFVGSKAHRDQVKLYEQAATDIRKIQHDTTTIFENDLEKQASDVNFEAAEEVKIWRQKVADKQATEKEFEAARTAIGQKATAEIQLISRQEVRAHEDTATEIVGIQHDAEAARYQASLVGTQNVINTRQDEIQALKDQYDQDLRNYQRELQDKKITDEEYSKLRTALGQKLSAGTKLINAEVKKDQDDLDKSWAQAGVDAGFTFLDGLKQGINSGSPLDIFKGLLGAAATVLAVLPGGQLAAGVVGGIGKLLHSGGPVGNPAPMVTAHSGMVLGGPRLRNDEIMVKAQKGEGVLSKTGMGSMDAEELDYRNRTGRAPGGGGGTTIVYAPSLDRPSYSAFAPKTAEPVSIRRLDDRKGSMYQNALMRAVRPRRAA